MWHEYPYTDAHELNLDWFLARFKEYYEHITEQDQKITTMEETVEQFTTFVTNYFDNLDVQQEINNKLDAMAASGELQAMLQPYFDGFVAAVNDQINTQNQRITALDARMDTFTHLTDGSTTGDAELADIRVGFNSITYPTAGDAVRACDTLINDKLTEVSNAATVVDYDSYFLRNVNWTSGYMNKAGNVSPSSSYHYSDPISVSEGDVIKIIGQDWRYLTAFNNGVAVSASGTEVARTYTVPKDIDSVVISCGPGITCVAHKVYQLSNNLANTVNNLGSFTSDIADATTRIIDVSESIGEGLAYYSGYMSRDGEIQTSPTYHYTELISCKEGDIFTSPNIMRYVTACYDEIPVYTAAAEVVYTYTVPSGVNGVYITTEISNTSIVYHHKKIINAINLPSDNTLVKEITASTFNDGETLVACSNFDNKKGDVISFYGQIDAADFGSVWVGHGKNVDSGSYIIVDDTNVTIIRGNNTVYYTAAHNLTIDKFLSIVIKHTDTARASVLLTTVSGSKSIDASAIAWTGSRGDVFATSVNSSFSNVKLSSTFEDLNRPAYLFGDSYVGLGDNARYATQLINMNYKNILIDGWSGRGSAAGLVSFKNVIAQGIPKYAIWNLGMNDPDSGEINATYKSCVDDFIATCEAVGIIPILSTIPNVPARDHTYKNTYVKSLGYRYIDFAAAVGAESAGSSWYTGMLSSDNVHPTELGAKALAVKFISDFPEIANNI